MIGFAILVYVIGAIYTFIQFYKGYTENGHSDRVDNMITGALMWPILALLFSACAVGYGVYLLFEYRREQND